MLCIQPCRHCSYLSTRQRCHRRSHVSTLTRVQKESPSAFEFHEDIVQLKQALFSGTAPSEKEGLLASQDLVEEDAVGSIVLPERVLLVGASKKKAENENEYSLHESLEELGSLAETAGLKVVQKTHQLLEAIHPTTYIGSGKLEQVSSIVDKEGISTVIFDEELSPVQLMNIEKTLGEGVRVCDRTALTLDIFSQRAKSKEGKLQVTLAQCKYQFPRLTRMWTHLERQVGGAGGDRAVKGMGEKQIEVDKRLLRHRMAALSRQLEEVKLHRRLKRNRRLERDMPVVTLVGYTNAGKSTLLNALTDADVMVEDKLFATLDPTTRRVKLPSGKEALLTDTVGFIQKLPPQLVAAFSATLEELLDSTLLLHVVDISSRHSEKEQKAVLSVLKTIGAQDLPVLTVWNKSDRLNEKDRRNSVVQARSRENTVCISAQAEEGMEELLAAIEKCIEESMVPVSVEIPYKFGEVLQQIHSHGIVKSVEHNSTGTLVHASVPIYLASQLKSFRVNPGLLSSPDL